MKSAFSTVTKSTEKRNQFHSLVSIFVRNPGLCEEACKGSPSQNANLVVWLKAAVADGRRQTLPWRNSPTSVTTISAIMAKRHADITQEGAI